MKKMSNTENQVVTVNGKNVQYASYLEHKVASLTMDNESMKRENEKLRDAVCSITGQLEAAAEIARYPYFGKTPDLKTAIEIYRQLVGLHKPSPLGRVSKQWVKEWNDKINYCYEQLDQARYDVEDMNQYLDDSLVIVE